MALVKAKKNEAQFNTRFDLGDELLSTNNPVIGTFVKIETFDWLVRASDWEELIECFRERPVIRECMRLD